MTNPGTDTYTGTATGMMSGNTYTFPAFVNGSSTLINLPADMYMVVITDTTSGCTGTQMGVVVAQGSTLGLSATPTAPLCFGGTGTLQYTETETNPAAVTADNVTETTSGYNNTFLSPITFPIMGTITSAAFTAGAAFNLTATDTQPLSTVNCTQNIMGTIPAAPAQLMASASATQQVSCNGGSDGQITAMVAGGIFSPIQLLPQWDTRYNNIEYELCVYWPFCWNSLYRRVVKIVNNCGPATASPITLTQPNSLMVSASATQQVSCNGGSNGQITATVAGGTAPYSYYLNGAFVTTTSNTSYVFTGLSAGIPYTADVNDTNNCGPATAAPITLHDQIH